jgi:hypothetical protein
MLSHESKVGPQHFATRAQVCLTGNSCIPFLIIKAERKAARTECHVILFISVVGSRLKGHDKSKLSTAPAKPV